MTSKERRDACLALIRWFDSQGIGPPDAVQVMLKVLFSLWHEEVTNADAAWTR